MPFWATESALEVHLCDFDYIFPCPLHMGAPLALELPMLLALDAELATNAGRAETLLQASYAPAGTTLGLSPSTLCHPVSGGQAGDPPTVAGSAISDPPPTPPSPTHSPPASDDSQDGGGDSPTSLDNLCRTLRQHYPNRKPPGHMFKIFISQRGALHHCTLCTYKIGNREQMNQHIMKIHCSHFPFVCPVPGW
jgi:hypothetical protein